MKHISRRDFLKVVGVSATAAALAACGGADSTAASTPAAGSTASAAGSSAAANGTITVGVVGPLTGTNAEDGIGFEVGTGIAADEINAAGGAAGYQLKIVANDSASDANQSADIVRQYGEDANYSVIIGDFTSGCCLVDVPVLEEYQIAMISPTASGSQLPGISPWFYTMSHTQAYEAPWNAEHVSKDYLGATSVGIMFLNTDWGNQVNGYLLETYEKVGVNVVANESYQDTEVDYSSVISKLNTAKPDVIVVVDQGNCPTIINQIRSAGIQTQIQLMGPAASIQIIDQCGENAEGVVTSTASLLTYENDKVSGFMKTFIDKTGFEAGDHAMCAYNSVYMIATAIENAVADGKTEINREVIKDYLKTAVFESPIGEVKFNELNGSNRQMLVVAIENGTYVVKCDYGYFN